MSANTFEQLDEAMFDIASKIARKSVYYNKPASGCDMVKLASIPAFASVLYGGAIPFTQELFNCIFSNFGLHAQSITGEAVNQGVKPSVIATIDSVELVGSCCSGQIEITVIAEEFTYPYTLHVEWFIDGGWKFYGAINITNEGENSATFFNTYIAVGDVEIRLTYLGVRHGDTTLINLGCQRRILIDTLTFACDGAVQYFDMLFATCCSDFDNLFLQYFDGVNWITFYNMNLLTRPTCDNPGNPFHIIVDARLEAPWFLLTSPMAADDYLIRMIDTVEGDVSNTVNATVISCDAPSININSATTDCIFSAQRVIIDFDYSNLPGNFFIIEYYDGFFWIGIVNPGNYAPSSGNVSDTFNTGAQDVPAGNFLIRVRDNTSGTVSNGFNTTFFIC